MNYMGSKWMVINTEGLNEEAEMGFEMHDAECWGMVIYDGTAHIIEGSMDMGEAIEPMEFVYHSYYFANQKGNVQVIIFATKQVFEENKQQCEDFLNGFVVR